MNALIGSDMAIRYAVRDLPNLEAVIRLVPGRTAAVQAGGCLGVYPAYLSKYFNTTYCFEPAQDLFAAMATNAPQPNIVRFQAALGCDRGLVGTARVRRDASKRPAHEGVTHVVSGGTVPTLRIDDLALPVCDLVYLDIEGMELEALRGGVETLARCRPVVALEINKNLAHVGLTELDVVGFIESHGYRHALSVGSDQAFVPEEWS